MSVGSEIADIRDSVLSAADELRLEALGLGFSYTNRPAAPPPATIIAGSSSPVTVNLPAGGTNVATLKSVYDSKSDSTGAKIDGVAFIDIGDVDTSGSPGEFTEEPPEFDAGEAPSDADKPNRDDIIGSAPEAISFGDEPVAPDLASIIGTMPALGAAAQLPSPPSLSEQPQFTAQLPNPLLLMDIPSSTNNPVTNFALTDWLERPYESELYDLIETRLSNDITLGRLGIQLEVEEKIWSRQLERNQMALDAGIRRINEEYSRAGFGLPPGKRDAAIRELIVTATYAKNDVSREVAIKQSELTQAWQQFAIQQGITMEQAQMDYVAKIAALAFNIAERSVENMLKIYNARVLAYNAELDRYKTEASVYESKMRAFLADIEIYKGELEAAKIKNSLRRDDIELYTLRLSQADAYMKIYAAQMDAYIQKANLQKLEYDIYGKKVEAFQASMQGYMALWSGYKTRVEAETGKQQGYIAQVEAYKGEIAAYEAKMGAEEIKVKAQAAANAAKAEQLRAYAAQLSTHIDAYKAGMAAYSTEIDAQARISGMEYDRIRSQNDIDLKAQELALQDKKLLGELAMESSRISSQEFIQKNNLEIQAIDAAGKIYQSAFTPLFNGVLGTYKATAS